jgi:hypothetical protein
VETQPAKMLRKMIQLGMGDGEGSWENELRNEMLSWQDG